MRIKSFIGKEKGKPFVAKDGALVFELFRHSNFLIKKLSIASGFLKPQKKAIPHFHKASEEIYYVLSGKGEVRVGNLKEKIKQGDAVYVPPKTIHALENTGKRRPLKVLAICSPKYSEKDMFFVK